MNLTSFNLHLVWFMEKKDDEFPSIIRSDGLKFDNENNARCNELPATNIKRYCKYLKYKCIYYTCQISLGDVSFSFEIRLFSIITILLGLMKLIFQI